MKITNEVKKLLLYMSIGDGYIHNKKGYFSVRHCVAQKGYLEWKVSLLKGSGVYTKDMYPVDNNGYGGFEFRTSSLAFLKLYRNILYPNGSKVIHNIKLLRKLTPLGLAIWYMDDGCLSQKKRCGVVHANELILNTYLEKDQNQVIIDYFKDSWDISFNQYKSKGKYRLACGTKEARRFLKIVEPYVSQVPCMLYKLNVKKELVTPCN